MTLWPSVITRLVGVAGIAGALLAARMTARSQTADLMLSIGEEKKAPGAARAPRPPELIHSLLPGRKAGSSGTLGPSVP